MPEKGYGERMMEIVRMKKEHCELLAELEKLCFAHPWSQKALEDEVDNPRSEEHTSELQSR